MFIELLNHLYFNSPILSTFYNRELSTKILLIKTTKKLLIIFTTLYSNSFESCFFNFELAYNLSMNINPTSIFVTILISVISLIRILYFMFANIRRYPLVLFKGKYLAFFILALFFDLASIILSLLFSNNFYYNGLFILWCSLTFIFICLYFVLWIIFWMHGYNCYYQFKKIIFPSPMSVLSFLALLISGFFTLNYFLILTSVIYFVFEYLWSYKGYMVTKPKITCDIEIKKEDD